MPASLNMHKGKYAIICKFKYAEICTKYAEPNMQEICTNMQIMNEKYAIYVHIAQNMHKYTIICRYICYMHNGKYAIICKLKYAEICLKYAAICSTKYAGICTGMQVRNMQQMCI